MASRAERRAALLRAAAPGAAEASIQTVAAIEPETHAFDPTPPAVHTYDGEPGTDYGFTTPEDPPMKILFQSVDLHKPLARLDAGKGQVTSTTTRHSVDHKVVIEYDTATQLVRISKGTACAYVPREGVECFGPTLDDAAADAAAKAKIAEATRLANEAAIAETAAAAAQAQ